MSSQLESGFIWRILFGLIAGLLLFLTVLRIAQNRTQEALIETEQLNSFLIGSLTEAILLINKEGIVRSCNKSACAMIRKSKEQIVGRPISVLMPNLLKSDQTSYRSNLHPFITLVLSGQVFTNIRLGLPMPDKIKWLRVNCQPLTVAGVDAGSCLFSITDITSLVEQEKELETQRMQLVQSSKLSALGEMAAGIAHEINNPLAVIRLEADAILESIEERQVDSSELQSSTEKIIGVVSRIAKIVRGLRTFARDGQVDPFKKEKVLDIVNDALALASIKIKQQGARIEVNIDEELWMECRVTQISQVLINLIHNSLDAIAGSESPWIRIEARVVQNMVDIAVVDSGAGLPAEVRDRIFHPFFTTKEVGKGTGLGLSISRGIAESHKGALFVDGSSMNTRFVLQLPHTQLENG